jgi:hypothetical protein
MRCTLLWRAVSRRWLLTEPLRAHTIALVLGCVQLAHASLATEQSPEDVRAFRGLIVVY